MRVAVVFNLIQFNQSSVKCEVLCLIQIKKYILLFDMLFLFLFYFICQVVFVEGGFVHRDGYSLVGGKIGKRHFTR